MHSFAVERELHPTSVGGFRYAANFEITLSGAAHAKLLLIVAWNATKTLAKGSTNTETKITGANVFLSKSGVGWSDVSDLPGEDAWVEHSDRVIRFTKRFALRVPVSPVLDGIPVVGEAVKDLGATTTWRVETEGFLDVVSYVGNLKTTIY